MQAYDQYHCEDSEQVKEDGTVSIQYASREPMETCCQDGAVYLQFVYWARQLLFATAMAESRVEEHGEEIVCFVSLSLCVSACAGNRVPQDFFVSGSCVLFLLEG